MSRTKKLVGVAVLAAAAGLAAAWSATQVREPARSAPQPQSAAPIPFAIRASSPGVLASADPLGTLRIEGQVIDASDQPVGGARVTIDAVPPRTAVTEVDGTFELVDLLPRSYTLAAVADEGAAGPVKVRVHASTEPIVLKLQSAAAVDVTVVDAERGQPVEGATVEVRAPIAASATTSSDGSAALAPIIPGYWPLVVAAPGFATAFEAITASPTARTKIAVALSRGFHVRGRVVDRNEKPVPNAVVWMENVSDWVSSADPSRDGARADDDGNFDLAGIARGSYVVSAIAPNRATATSAVIHVDADVSGIVVRVLADKRIVGRVVRQDRSPATDASVRARWSNGSRVTHVDATGEFSIDGLPGEPVWVSASNGEASSKPQRIDLSAATPERVELVLDNTATIAGIVVDRAGNPVEGAQVAGVRENAFDAGGSTYVQDLSDSSGRFMLRGLVAGYYTLSASREAASRSGGGPPVVAETGRTDVTLTIESTGRIRGRVAFANGGAPAAYSVRLGRSGLPSAFATEQFEIEAPIGTRALWIEGPGFTARSVDGIEVQPDAVADAGTIELDRGRTVRGQVTAAAGVTVAHAQIVAGALLSGTGQRVDSGDHGPAFRSDVKRTSVRADGTFEISGIATTAVSVVATLSSGARSAPAQIPAGTADIDGILLTVHPDAQLSGTVSKASKPARAIVNAQPHESPLAMSTVMTQDGSYHFDRLAPGRYTVAAIWGAPLAGSPFYPKTVELTPSSAKTLDLEIAPGDATLTVQAPGVESGLVFVTTRPGTASSALTLLAELGRQDGGQWAMMPLSEHAATFRELARGPVRACVVQIPNKTPQTTSALVEQLARTGATLRAACVTTELDATGTVTIEAAASEAR